MSQQRDRKPNSKLWAWVGLIIAGVILLLGGWLIRQEEPAQARPTPTLSPATPAETESPEAPGAAPWLGAETDFDYYVLALSWQPAFCETEPRKEECVTQDAGRYDAHNFALHGLWPSNFDRWPDYCDLSPVLVAQDKEGDWCDLPELDVSDDVRDNLVTLMPGTASCLENHEWYKHGTCAGMSSEAYFALSNHLTEMFSRTAFDDYVADHTGEMVRRNDLLDQFASEFGSDNLDYFSLRCERVGGTSLLTEIQLALRPEIPPDATFGELFPIDDMRPRGSCPTEFKIDLVGLGNY